jgi:hypothetical protein
MAGALQLSFFLAASGPVVSSNSHIKTLVNVQLCDRSVCSDDIFYIVLGLRAIALIQIK